MFEETAMFRCRYAAFEEPRSKLRSGNPVNTIKRLFVQVYARCCGHNSKPCCRAPFPESFFTGGVLGHMFLQQTTPQGLKCSAAAIHGVQFGKVGMGAAVVTPLNPMACNTRILFPGCFVFCHAVKNLQCLWDQKQMRRHKKFSCCSPEGIFYANNGRSSALVAMFLETV